MKIAQEHEPVPCPRCGNRMNRHAEKVVHRGGGEALETGETRTAFDGVIEEFHTCPVCRYVLERPPG